MKPKSFSTPSERSNFYKELFSLAVPIGLQNLLVALIGASDALMLGRLTQDAVAAVSLANQIAFSGMVHRGISSWREHPPGLAGLQMVLRCRYKRLFRISLPMLGSSLAWGIGFSMHSLIMGHLGSDATAAASITSVAQELITCVCKGFSSGAGIMVGKLLGQNLFDQAKQYGKKFCHLSF